MSRRHSTPRAEADVVTEMVLALVREVVRQVTTPPRVQRREPTGVTVHPEFRPFVDKRSDKRKAS